MVESGRTNVSVTRLVHLAAALDKTASDLLSQERTTAALTPVVALLGLRGAGKTAIGRAAAARLGVPFNELDALVATRAGMSLGQIFEMHGGSYYRRLEREELERFLEAGLCGILATGGSLVTEHATYERLRGASITIWLRAKPEDHWSRVVAQGDARPMANRSDAMRELRMLLRARRPLYELADHVVDTSALGFEGSIDRLIAITRRARPKPSC
jgi:XRE family aerobic/anaerobic benzoate catabolism transcriptional regulator